MRPGLAWLNAESLAWMAKPPSMSRPWDARRITAAVISAVIVAVAVVAYLLGLGPVRVERRA